MKLIIWVEPASADISDPIYNICTENTATALGHEMGKRNSFVYSSDNEALTDFMIKHWAWRIDSSALEKEVIK